jgi:hypothetical protein
MNFGMVNHSRWLGLHLRRQYLKRSFIDLSDLLKVFCYSSGKNDPLSDPK